MIAEWILEDNNSDNLKRLLYMQSYLLQSYFTVFSFQKLLLKDALSEILGS